MSSSMSGGGSRPGSPITAAWGRLAAALVLATAIGGCATFRETGGPPTQEAVPGAQQAPDTDRAGRAERAPDTGRGTDTARLPDAERQPGIERPPTTPRPPVSKEPSQPGQTGYASWYGKAHHGRQTASGEAYDMNARTAAHPSFPMGTRLQVTNLENGKTVTVRVNDRGPDVAGRIIDLSYAAARDLGAVGDGVVPVRVRVLSKPPP